MFASEPMADVYRVSLLGEMLDRFDELIGQGMTHMAAVSRVQLEFSNIARRMHDEGFTLLNETYGTRSSVWPRMTEKEAARYIEQSSECAHKKSMGIAMLSGSLGILFLAQSVFLNTLFGAMIGSAGMFAAVGVGVYLICAAGKPDDAERVKKGRFTLDPKLRKKLRQLKGLQEKKGRKRRAKGIAVCATCLLPAVIGLMFGFDEGVLLGIAGLFAMVGFGVYEIVMANKESKAAGELLGRNDGK